MMKEKHMRKSFIINCLLFTAVVFSALSCYHGSPAPEESVPHGYGKVRVVFSDVQVRTVFPAPDFNNYEYIFTKSGGSAQKLTPDANNEFTLEAGSWTLVVKGYVGTVSAANLAATGTASFTVSPGTQQVRVELTAYKTSGDGIFTCSVTYPASATPTISLINFADNAPVTILTSTATSGVASVISGTVDPIAAGAYLLIVKLQDGDKYAGVSEAVYITPSLKTSYNAVFTAADLINAKPLSAADFNVGGTTVIYDGSPKAVTVTDIYGKTTGAITVYYEGEPGTNYTRSATPPAEVGTYIITVQVTAVEGWKSESALPVGQLVINKAPGAAVGTPTMNSTTHNNITVDAVTAPVSGQAVEYAISTASDGTGLSAWQPGTILNGLNGGTTYYVYARSASNANYEAGTASISAGITTPKAPGAAVTTPTVSMTIVPTSSSITVNTVTVIPPGNGQSVEYAISVASNVTPATGWQTGTAFTGLIAGTTYYVYARTQESANYEAGTASVSAGILTNNIETIFVPGGSFQMGSTTGNSNEMPVHTVTLTGFYIGKYEVTQAQYQAVMNSNPSNFSSSPASGEVQVNRPVEQVSWYGAIVFCNKLSMMVGLTPAYSIGGSTDPADWGNVPTTSNNSVWDAVTIISGSSGYRLPTEAQWEYAAKGGNGSPENYTYPGSNAVGNVAWYYGNSSNMTHEVGKKTANGLGLYDMGGNVAEYCWDWYGNYSSGAQNNPAGPSTGTTRVDRGGGWYSADSDARSTARGNGSPYSSYYNNSFRVALPQTVTVPVSGVSLNKTGTSLMVDGTETLTATIAPPSATNQNVTWSSDSAAIATVNNGTITAVSVGTAVITVTTAESGYTAMCTVTVSPGSGAAVGVPIVSGAPAYNSITVSVVTAPTNGQTVEYAISTASDGTGLSAWQTGTTFTGLNMVTTYYVYARSKENTNYYAGTTPSVSAGITTPKAPGDAVGIPTVSGTPAYNSITVSAVTAPASGQTVEYAISTASNTVSSSLTWQDTTTFGSLNMVTTYYVYARSKENANYYAGTTPSVSTAITTPKAPGASVGTPTVNGSPAYNSITVNTITITPANGQTVEYAISTINNVTPTTGWQNDTTFSGLNMVTTYYVYARSQENANYNAGAASVSVGITTPKAPGATVTTPTVSGTPTYISITVSAVTVTPSANGQTAEYAISTASNGTGLSAWQDGRTFTGLTPGITYYVYARSKENANYYAGATRVSTGITTNSTLVMIYVSGGSFQMGKELNTGSGYSDVTPVHTVTLDGFYIGKYEVTQAQYQTVMGSNPSWFKTVTVSGEVQANRPVEKVSWYAALVFCNYLSMIEGLSPAYRINNSTNPLTWGTVPTTSNTTWDAVTIVSGSNGYRLPTEAQWEYAAKGGASQGNYTYAGSNTAGNVAWYDGNSSDGSDRITHEVGKKAPNGLGLYDMSGNVSEWCYDWSGAYSSAAQTNPTGPGFGSQRITRGGSHISQPDYTRSVYRTDDELPSDTWNTVGFRVVRPQ